MTPEKPLKPVKSETLAQLGRFLADERVWTMLVYALLFFMPWSMGFSGVLAITIIYLVQDDASPLAKTHLEFQKNTFWYGIGGVIASLLALGLHLPFLPYVFFIPTFLWVVGRVVVGFNHLMQMRPHPDPKTLWA